MKAAFLIGFLPWFAFWIVSSQGDDARDAMILASVVGLVVALVLLARSATRHEPISSLEPGSAAAFVILAVIAVFAAPEFVEDANQVVSTAALLVIVLAGLVTGHPFTLAYAKAQTPPEVWDKPGFIRTNVVLTRGWAIAFAVGTVSSALGLLAPQDELVEILASWIIPLAAIVVCVRWQMSYVAHARREGQERRAAAAGQAEGAARDRDY